MRPGGVCLYNDEVKKIKIKISLFRQRDVNKNTCLFKLFDMTNQKFTSKLSTCEDLLLPYFVLSFNISNYAVR